VKWSYACTPTLGGAAETMFVRMILIFLCCMMAAPTWAGPREKPDLAGPDSTEIDRAVRALCSKDVVLLGEDASHEGAATIAVKARLVERLVRECGFRGVVFESQFYDMLDFEHAVAAGTATQTQLADAIGALWSRYRSFTPLMDWLFSESMAGRVHMAGMDPQVGGITAQYSQQQLAGVLSSVLAGNRRTDCESTIDRHDQWKYDDTHPFDAAVLRHLRDCLRDIGDRLDAMGRRAPSDLRAMADSYASYLDFADGDERGMRDQAMYRNLVWIRAHWPKGTRIVVWCASVHAAKTLEGARPGIRPLGSYVHEALGARAAAIGFSALAGSYGHVGGHGAARVLDVAAPGALETRTYAAAGTDALRFLDHAQLKAMSKVSARALVYGEPYTLDWSRLLDGMIVLREETAAMAKP
jgi:Erythromycin esterase homolog